MAYNLFIDTDVILDILLNGEKHYDDSAAIFKCFENNSAKLYTSATVVINAQYIAQKQIAKEKCRSGMIYLLNYFELMEPDKSIVLKAYKSGFSDIEDAIQYFTAHDSGIIDFIITRNIKDYKIASKTLPVVTPAQFLKQHIR